MHKYFLDCSDLKERKAKKYLCMADCETSDFNKEKTTSQASVDAPAPRGTRQKSTGQPVYFLAILRKKVYFFLRKCVAFCAKSVMFSNTNKKGVSQMWYFKAWHAYTAAALVLGTIIAHVLGVC